MARMDDYSPPEEGEIMESNANESGMAVPREEGASGSGSLGDGSKEAGSLEDRLSGEFKGQLLEALQ